MAVVTAFKLTGNIAPSEPHRRRQVRETSNPGRYAHLVQIFHYDRALSCGKIDHLQIAFLTNVFNMPDVTFNVVDVRYRGKSLLRDHPSVLDCKRVEKRKVWDGRRKSANLNDLTAPSIAVKNKNADLLVWRCFYGFGVAKLSVSEVYADESRTVPIE